MFTEMGCLLVVLQSDPLGGLAGLACCGLVVGVPLYLLWHNNNQKQLRLRQIEEAERTYRNALRDLKRNPNNPDLKQKTLALGRQYSAICRENNAATIYDEMAIMNDINAATANATQHQPSDSQHTTNKLSIEDRLTKLNDLKNKGLIDETEYLQRKQKLLDEV